MGRYGMRRREKYREKYRAQRQAFLLLAAVAAGRFFGCRFAVAAASPRGALGVLAMGIYAAYKAGRIRPSPALRDYAAGKGGDWENPFTWERNR